MQEAIFGLLGVLVGGFVSYLNSINLAKKENKWQYSKLKRERLYEIANISDKIQDSYFLITTSLSANKNQFVKNNNTEVPINKLKLLIKFYAPELEDKLKLLYELRSEWGEYFVEYLNSNKKDLILKNLFITSMKINEVCDYIYEKSAIIAQDESPCKNDKDIIFSICNLLCTVKNKIESFLRKNLYLNKN